MNESLILQLTQVEGIHSMENELFLKVNRNSSKKLQVQIYEFIKDEILHGRLKPGSKLPAVRYLAKETVVSKNTVEAAYSQLLSEGYIKSKSRSGYFVEQLNIEYFSKRSSSTETINTARTKVERYPYDFRSNRIDTEHFPISNWQHIINRCLKEEHDDVYTYGDPQGEYGLRREIASYLRQSRGVNCVEEQIVIGSNAQYLLNLFCQMIGINQQEIAFEDPGYYAARSVFELFGYQVTPISVNESGINLDELFQTKAAAVYVTPSHQIPLGVIMPVKERLQLLEWARVNKSYIIEDDVNNEFRYAGEPIPSLQHLDEHGNVVYMGTFFRSLLPSVRLNYMVLPKQLLKTYQEHFQIYQQTTSRITQKTVELFMSEGHWIRHVRRMRTIYKKKYVTAVEAIQTNLSNEVEILGEEAGLHIILKVNLDYSVHELLSFAQEKGVMLETLNVYYANKDKKENSPPLLLLSFSALRESEIREGIQLLKEAWIR